MIGTSTVEYVFIRTCIVGIRVITPLSILYCVSLPFLDVRPPLLVSAWPIAETAFYFLVYLPRKVILQRPAIHPYPLPKPEREELFQRCMEHITDPEQYLVKWFKDAPLSEIKRENVKEFFRWAFLNKKDFNLEDEEELEEYVEKFKEYSGIKLEPGVGNLGSARCLRLTIDEVRMMHRPLVWYLTVFVVDNITHISMLYHGFKYHRTSLTPLPTIFPPRPLALLTTHRSPVNKLSYWLRPHTSKTSLPIVFLHGIGIGLWTYVNSLAALNAQKVNDDGEVGIIAIELLPISFRITHSALGKEEMCRQIQTILLQHGYEKFVLVTHSYGSTIATHLLKHPILSPQIASLVLVDPPTFLLHLPDVAYNFTYRHPRGANEWQLWYFACQDPDAAHTLSRTFFWSENILWKEDIAGANKNITIFLGGRDLIVDARSVWRYLTGLYREGDERGEEWIAEDGKSKVFWAAELDHAQIFESGRRLPGLVGEVLKHSRAQD